MVDLGDTLIDILLVRDDQPQVEETKEGWTLIGFQYYLLAIASLIAWIWTGAQCMFDCLKDHDWWLLIQDTAGAQYPRSSRRHHRQIPPSSELPATVAEHSRPVANRNSRSRKNVIFRPTRRVLSCSNETRQLCNQMSLDSGGGEGAGAVLLTLHPRGVWLPQALPGELGPVLQTHQSFWTEFTTSLSQATKPTRAPHDLPIRLEKSSSELPRLTPKALVPRQLSEIGHREIFHREPGSPPASDVRAKHCTCTCPCSPDSFTRPGADSLSSQQDDCIWTKSPRASSTNLAWNTTHLSTSEASEASLAGNNGNDGQVGGDGISESLSASSSHSETSGESHRQDSTGWEVSDVMEDTALRLVSTSEETLTSRIPEQHCRHHHHCERLKHRHFAKPKLKRQPVNFGVTDHCSSFSVNEAVTDLLSGNFDIICSKYSGLNQKFPNDHGDVSSPHDNNRDGALLKIKRNVKTISSCCSLEENSLTVNQSRRTRRKQRHRPAFRKQLQKRATARRIHQGHKHQPGPHTIKSNSLLISQVPRVRRGQPMNTCWTGDPKRKYERDLSPKIPRRLNPENFASKQEETIIQSPGHRVRQVTGALDLFHLEDMDIRLNKPNCSSDQISRPLPYSRRRFPQRGSRLKKLRRRRCSYPYIIPRTNRHPKAEECLQKHQHFKDYRKESLSNFFSASSLVPPSPLGTKSDLSSGHLGHYVASQAKHTNMLQAVTEENKASPDKREFPSRFIKRTRFPVFTERPPITTRSQTTFRFVKEMRRESTDVTHKSIPWSNEPYPNNDRNCLGRQEDSHLHLPHSEPPVSVTPSTVRDSNSESINQPTGHCKPPFVDAFETTSTQLPMTAGRNAKPPMAGTRPRHAQEKVASTCRSADRINRVIDRTGDGKVSPKSPISKGKRFEEYVYRFHPGRPSPLSPYTDSITENVNPMRDQKMVSSNDSLMTGKSKSGAKISKLPVYLGRQITGRLTPVQRPKDPTPNTPLALVRGPFLKPGNNKSPDSLTGKARGSVGDMVSSTARTHHFNDFHSLGSGQNAAKEKTMGSEQRRQQRVNLETGQRSGQNAAQHSDRHEGHTDNLRELNFGLGKTTSDKRPNPDGQRWHSRLVSAGSPCHSKQGSVGGSQYPRGENIQSHPQTCVDAAHSEVTQLIFPKRQDALKPTPPHPTEKKTLALSTRPAYPGVPRPSLKRTHPLKTRDRPWRINARLAKDRTRTTAGLKDKGHAAH